MPRNVVDSTALIISLLLTIFNSRVSLGFLWIFLKFITFVLLLLSIRLLSSKYLFASYNTEFYFLPASSSLSPVTIIVVSSANLVILQFLTLLDKSSKYNINSRGPRTDP